VIFLVVAALAVVRLAVQHRTWRPRPYVGRHWAPGQNLDRLWTRRLAELAARRRGMGWA
jgi:hypothetical protein